ncbi:MAG: hypothetical protein ACTSX8_08515 [Alphaproteobacteria bacterium]
MRALGMLSSGRTGRAMVTLATIGITRQKLQGQGLKFNKAGGLADTSAEGIKQAMDAVFKHMRKNYGGMFERMEDTFDVQFSNVSDTWFRFWAEAGKPLLDGVTPALVEIQGFIKDMTAKVKKLNMVPWAVKILATVKTIRGFINELFDPQGRQSIFADFLDSLKQLPTIFGTFLGEIISNAGVLFQPVVAVLIGAFNIGAQILAGAMKAGVKDAWHEVKLNNPITGAKTRDDFVKATNKAIDIEMDRLGNEARKKAIASGKSTSAADAAAVAARAKFWDSLSGEAGIEKQKKIGRRALGLEPEPFKLTGDTAGDAAKVLKTIMGNLGTNLANLPIVDRVLSEYKLNKIDAAEEVDRRKNAPDVTAAKVATPFLDELNKQTVISKEEKARTEKAQKEWEDINKTTGAQLKVNKETVEQLKKLNLTLGADAQEIF